MIAKQYHEAGNEIQALVYVAKGCKAGYAAACIHAAKALESGEDIDADPVKAAAFWKEACKLGDDTGCDGFARLRAEGIEPIDSDVAGCNRGDVDGCLRAARERFDAGDVAGSIELTAKACEAGSLDACRHAAIAYETGDGVEPDLDRAAALNKSACKLGGDDGCESFARLRSHASESNDADVPTESGSPPSSQQPAKRD